MKISKLDKLNTVLQLYNTELNSLYQKQHDFEVELINKKDTLSKVDPEGIKYSFGASIPTCLGALIILLLPGAMAFSIPSIIITACSTIISAYLAIPNYIKWAKNLKQCDKLDKEIKEITKKIEDVNSKIEIINNKIDLTSKLINSYEKEPVTNTPTKKQTTTLNKTNSNFKNKGIER